MTGPGAYLLHFSEPIAPGLHTCQHYAGSAIDVDERIAQHESGRGARLCQVAIERGIGIEVARVWTADTYTEAREIETYIKARKSSPELCPICAGLKAYDRGNYEQETQAARQRKRERQPKPNATPGTDRKNRRSPTRNRGN